MTDSQRPTDRWGSLADATLAVIVLGAPLAVGTVHPSAWMAVWALSCVAVLGAWRSADRFAFPSNAFFALVALAGASVALSLAPLPPAFVQALSPEAASVWALGPVGGEAPSGWRPWHQAPGPGRFQLLRWSAVATFVLACAGRTRRLTSLRVSLLVVSAGLIAIVVAGVQTALGVDAIFGVYTPTWGFPTDLRSPIVNPNHFGAYVGVVAVLAVGLVLRTSVPTPARLLGLVTGAAAIVALAMTGSRGAALGTAVSFSVLAALSLRRVDRNDQPRAFVLGVVASAIPLIVLVFWVQQLTPQYTAEDTGMEETLAATEPRLENLPAVIDLFQAHAWTGVGRGAFADSFPRFRESHGRVVFAHVEALPLQVLVDHGAVLGGGLLLLIGWVLALCLRGGWRQPQRAAAAAALLGLAVHELFDFSTESGAVLLTAVLLTLLCLHRGDPWRYRRWGAAVALAGAALVCLPYPAQWRQTADFEERIGQRTLAPEELQAASEDLWVRHPSSWFLALQLARSWAVVGDLSMALQWTNRAMLLAPRQPDPHLLAARLLRRFGGERQALGEYRLAHVADLRVTGRAVVGEVSRGYDDPDALQRLRTPDRPDLDPWIALFGLGLGDPRARELAHEVWRDLPDNQLAFAVEAWALAGEGATEESLILLRQRDPRELTEYVQLQMAWVANKAGDTDLAVELLWPILDGPEGPRSGLWLLAGTWLVELGRGSEARSALRRARSASALEDPRLVSESLRLEARLERRAGELAEALELLHRADQAAPNQLDVGLDEVRLLWEMGRSDDSLARLGTLAYIHADEPGFRSLAAELGWTPPDEPEDSGPGTVPGRGER